MTMPDERTRALRWGFELLAHLEDDSDLTEPLRARALATLPDYPSPQRLEQLISSDAQGLPRSWANAMSKARGLFDEIWFGQHGSTETRHHLLYTLRHHPDEETIRAMACTDSLSDWLLPEDHYR